MATEAELQRQRGIQVIDVEHAFEKYTLVNSEPQDAKKGLRIGVTGANSTGITTVAGDLAQALHLPLLSEVARAVFERGFKPGTQGSMVSQSTIWFTQLFVENHESTFVADRFVICALAHAELLAEMSSDSLDMVCATAMANATSVATSHYDAIFYTPIEFGLVDDGVRDTDEAFREQLATKIVELFHRYNLTYYELRGTPQERLTTAIEVLQNLDLVP